MTTTPTALWTFDALVAAAGATADGGPAAAVTGISIDTRTLAPGDLFVALKDQRDGHEFVTTAFAAGAAAALVSTAYPRRDGDGLLLRVDDPLAALTRLAIASRARLPADARVFAITGSAGKTTTKEMLAACCRLLGATHASEKSYNNHWGVPLTLARMPAATRMAIFEIGMNHAGEITPLVALVRPDVAIITTVAAAHIEHFDSEEGIADAKAEILTGLAPGGVAVLPADNRHFARLAAAARARPGVETVVFGRAPPPGHLRGVTLAAAHAFGDSTQIHCTSLSGADGHHIHLGAVGDHMVQNALAVIAALEAAGCDARRAAGALGAFAAPKGRGERLPLPIAGGAILLIDESYNANPASMRAALATLATLPRDRHPRRIAVLGEMLELGAEARALHLDLAEAIDGAGIDLVFATGPNMRALLDSLPAGKQGQWAERASDLDQPLASVLRPGDAVMVKGSNGSRTWQLVEALKARSAATAAV